jgi:Xaa-Pro dipeptidase
LNAGIRQGVDMTNAARIAEMLIEIGADWAVLTEPDSVCFATGHVTSTDIVPNPFAGGSLAAFVGRDGMTGLVCSNTEAGGLADDLPAEVYLGFDCAVTNHIANYADATRKMAKRLGVSGRLAVQGTSFTLALAEILGGETVSLDADLARLRAVKTEQEIKKMRVSAAVAACGQTTAREISKPGISELGALETIRGVMEDMAGGRFALAGEFLAGVERRSTLGATPSPRRLAKGDPVLCDIAPRVNGYWGDSCGSFVVGGEPDADYERMFNAAHATLELAISEMRPGLAARDVDSKLRDFITKQGFSYPHHSGHGIGTSVHEYPRLVPDEPPLLEEGMVIMVEPGSYVAGVGGLRTEHMLLVTATGAEVLTPFEINCRL